jgi:hypothetical protein
LFPSETTGTQAAGRPAFVLCDIKTIVMVELGDVKKGGSLTNGVFFMLKIPRLALSKILIFFNQFTF